MLHTLLKELQISLDAAAEKNLLVFLDELLHWNRSINLTAIEDRESAIEKHLVDALTLLPLLNATERLLDMGSGAGLPGLALKIARPELQLVSVDAVAKKLTFQRHVIRTLGLTGVETRHGRLEVLGESADLRGQFSVVTARAFATLEVCARLARPFLAPGGRLLAMKGPEGGGELAGCAAALEQLGYAPARQHLLRLPRSGAQRLLIELQLAPAAAQPPVEVFA